eukprot:6455511-Amphidinium_carterae.1
MGLIRRTKQKPAKSWQASWPACGAVKVLTLRCLGATIKSELSRRVHRIAAVNVGDYFKYVIILTILFWALTEIMLRLGWTTSSPCKCGAYLTSSEVSAAGLGEIERLYGTLLHRWLDCCTDTMVRPTSAKHTHTQYAACDHLSLGFVRFSWGQAKDDPYVRQACHCYLLRRVHLSVNQTAELGGLLCGISPQGVSHEDSQEICGLSCRASYMDRT